MKRPTVDPNVQYVGTSYLRHFSADRLAREEKTIVVQDAQYNPLVVVIPYKHFLEMQTEVESWKGRAAKHGCDVDNGDPDCG